jgi:sulfur-oxidizing protein SoxY
MKEVTNKGLSRRGFFATAGAGALAVSVVGLKPGEALADASTTKKAIAMVTGGKETQSGRIKIDAPQIAENGRVVPLAVTVDSPMTESDYVKAVHIFVQNNPNPEVASFKFTPDCGQAHVSFRCRMGKTSPVIAVAEMSDGSVYQQDVVVKVTIGGCGG